MIRGSVPTLLPLLFGAWLGTVHALPGFVSGELLRNWCDKNEGLDREACYSYLRGASDAFHAIADVSAAENAGNVTSPWPNECMPPRISITSLRDVFLEFAAKNPDRLGTQAAVLLAEVIQENFPCKTKAEEQS